MYRWRAELQFDTRKRKCLRNDLCVICGLREQFIHHSANCWQLAFPGELIWWQPPAFSCHCYRSWAYSYHHQAYWAHLAPSMHTKRRPPLWDRESHQEWTRGGHWRGSWSAPRMAPGGGSECFDNWATASIDLSVTQEPALAAQGGMGPLRRAGPCVVSVWEQVIQSN